MKPWLLVVLAFVAITAALAAAYRIWSDLGEVQISTNGWIALTLGGVLTLALGGGLMSLVFFSSRRGHDDAQHDKAAFRPPPPSDLGPAEPPRDLRL